MIIDRNTYMIYKICFKSAFIFCLMCCVFHVKAQEVLFPLSSNPVIRQYLKAHPASITELRIQTNADTISLPIIDDFSGPGIYPTDSIWSDSAAFINTSYCDRPPTIGVATLDGINKYGNPYDPFSAVSDKADYLTTKPIDLNYPTDTTIWLSFFYQPEGLGDQPELDDSLTLQFLSSTGIWNVVWSAAGRPDTAFKRVNIHITDPTYKYRGFRFRFMNYATINGNRDHWNIDYVWLAKSRNANDSMQDVAFVNPQHSILAEYQAIPWSHYNVAPAAVAIRSNMIDTVRNLGYGQTTISYVPSILDAGGNVLYTQPQSSISCNPCVNIDYVSPLGGFTFPGSAGDSAEFLIKNYISPNGTFNLHNDTVIYHQKFYNYYAYDDGTAEWAYGIPEAGAKIAYQFNVIKHDTLRGVQIYFNQVGELVHNKLFQLCLWSSINLAANTDQLVYKMIDQKPRNIDSINGFATFLFDTTLVVDSGTIWIGWIQNDATLLGIGVDRNTSSTSKMFAFYSGYWYQSQVPGSWMMRPLFGDSVIAPIGIDEPLASSFSFDVYPNPVNESFSIAVHGEKKSMFAYRLFNNLGEIVLSGNEISGQINISSLANGFYFIRLTNKKSGESVTKKLVVLHD